MNPTSASDALYRIIENVISSGASNTFSAWAAVSGHRPDTAEFALFHAQLMSLLNDVKQEIAELPLQRQRVVSPYFTHWWNALVLPRADWGSTPETHLIGRSELDNLGMLASLVESRAALSPMEESTLNVLHEQLQEALNTVQEETELPRHIKEQLIADLTHALWLFDNANTFGDRAFVAAATQVSGKVTVATARPTASARLKKAAVSIVAALVLVEQGVQHAEGIIEGISNIYSITSGSADQPDLKDVVRQVVAPPAAIEPPVSSSEAEDAIDVAEVSDDHQR